MTFRDLTDAEIEHYLRAEQPYDCAGSAKSETLGIALLGAIDSDDPTALVGLPLIRTCALLREAGIDPLRRDHDDERRRAARCCWCPTRWTSARPSAADRRRAAAGRAAARPPAWRTGWPKTPRPRAPFSSACTPWCRWRGRCRRSTSANCRARAKGARRSTGRIPIWRRCWRLRWPAHDIGLISEAGLPAVADPGAALVAAAHRLGIAVRPLAGPSSLMLALAASGLNGQSFAFVGYLPQTRPSAPRACRRCSSSRGASGKRNSPIETPYRNAALMAALLEALHADTQLSVACGLTLPGGWCAHAQRRAVARAAACLRRQAPAGGVSVAGRLSLASGGACRPSRLAS